MLSPRSVTTPLVALIMIPGTPALRMPPTVVGLPSMVMDLVMVTAPKPAGSRASISPLVAVFEMAPAKVLQGAVRLHGLASSPTPDTQVRDACAFAVWPSRAKKDAARMIGRIMFLGIGLLPSPPQAAFIEGAAGRAGSPSERP